MGVLAVLLHTHHYRTTMRLQNQAVCDGSTLQTDVLLLHQCLLCVWREYIDVSSRDKHHHGISITSSKQPHTH